MAELNPNIFREYDIRGVADEDLTDEAVSLIARAFATFARGKTPPKCVVGRDNRLSSPRIQEALVSGLTTSGFDVVDLGEVITPMLYFAREHLGIDAAVMITGSHNDAAYNGLKLCVGPGSLYGRTLKEIGERAVAEEFVSGHGSVEEFGIFPAYREMLVSKVRLGSRRLRAVVDCGNGTGSAFAPELLEALGCEVVRLYCESDGHFPNHHPDPTKPKNLVDLIDEVKRTGAEVGIGLDGDADRLGGCDNLGRIIWPDQFLILFAEEVLSKRPGSLIIGDVKTSQALVDVVTAAGGKPLLWKTGHSLIKAKMREEDSPLGGEMSGHMFFRDEYYGYDDAVYATSRLLRILSNTDKKLSQLLDEIPHYFVTAELRPYCPDEQKFDIVARIAEVFRQQHEVLDVDGARAFFPGGWGLVRASNTQPELSLRCEAKTEAELSVITRALEEELAKYLDVKLDWSGGAE